MSFIEGVRNVSLARRNGPNAGMQIAGSDVTIEIVRNDVVNSMAALSSVHATEAERALDETMIVSRETTNTVQHQESAPMQSLCYTCFINVHQCMQWAQSRYPAPDLTVPTTPP